MVRRSIASMALPNFILSRVSICITFALISFACEAGERLPVPDKDLCAAALSKVTDVLKNELAAAAKSTSKKRELVDQLLKLAYETKDDPVSRFVLLEMAVETATKVGDIEKVYLGIDEIAKYHVIDAPKRKSDAFSSVANNATTKADFDNIMSMSTRLVVACTIDDRFDLARSVCDQISETKSFKRFAKKDRRDILKAQIELVERLRNSHALASDAQKTLETAKDDAAANLIVGKFYLSKGKWASALPYLAHSGDTQCKKLAAMELGASLTIADRIALADGWWDLAENDSHLRLQLRLHSADLYREFVGESTGLTKKKLEDRVREAGQIAGSTLDALIAAEAKRSIPIKIISARWGGGNNWSDVTGRVQELVNRREWIWASTSGLKSDPTPGWRKRLEINYEVDGSGSSTRLDEDKAWKPEQYLKK